MRAFRNLKRLAHMATGKKAASDAGKMLRNPKATKKQKEVAASDLAQRKRGNKKKQKEAASVGAASRQ